MHASDEEPNVANDELEEVEPNDMITIDQDFSVNETTMEFSEGYLSLELMLADPITGRMRSIQRHQMHMQISGVYSLSPNPCFLLVVNSKTPNHAIHQIIAFIRHRLHTYLDIFNLSLTGSFTSPVTRENVLKSYAGKSVIIFGNSFPYFDQGVRDPWELLDRWQTSLLIKGGTNILFVSVTNLDALKVWADRSTFPAHDFTHHPEHSIASGNVDGLVIALRRTDPLNLAYDMTPHRFPVQKGTFGTIQSTVDSAAKSAAKKLNKSLPLRRFVVIPDAGAVNEAEKRGGVIVCEGVPKNSKILASVGPFAQSAPGTNAISDYNMYFIVSCLPFSIKARMFWNMIGRADTNGILCDTIYAGLEGFQCKPYGEDAGQARVDERVIEALPDISCRLTYISRFFRLYVSRSNLTFATKSTASRLANLASPTICHSLKSSHSSQ
jgi:hypothetical protein